jgi:hypothetical protein
MGSRLSLAAGLGFVAVGIGAFAAPARAARIFGLATSEQCGGLAFVRATAARDFAFGLLVTSFASRGAREPLAATVSAGVLISLADFSTVLRGHGAVPSLAAHAGGALGLGVLWILLRVGI